MAHCHVALGPETGMHSLRLAPLVVCAASLAAQLITDPAQIPRTGKPPVVFVNGYQSGCSNVSFAGTFGLADQVMERDGRVSLFFNNCAVGDNSTSIEELGNGLGRFLDSLRYTSGEPVPQVDVIAHSMGGLIVRSYLAGKQEQPGVFTPPARVAIRKAVFLATPHFGTPVASRDSTRQAAQLAPASDFLFDLATWNQGQDDLRGIDFVSVLGNAGNEAVRVIGVDWPSGFHDSTVSLMSGSMDFTLAVDRNRVLNHCHTGGFALLACNSTTRIADLSSEQHESARIALAFLNSTEDWRSVGQPLSTLPVLRNQAGLILRWRTANDEPVVISTAAVRPAGSTGAFVNLNLRDNEIAHVERLPAGATEIRLSAAAAALNATVDLQRGAYRAITLKAGPQIAAVAPVFRPIFPRAVAPGMFVSLYGSFGGVTEAAGQLPYPTTLAGTEVLAGDRPLPLHFVGPQQINAVLPEDIAGMVPVTVRNASGRHTVRVLVEPAAPSLFETPVNAITGALIRSDLPARPGDYLSIYLTGLGATERRADGLDWAREQPEVTLGGRVCTLLYAGRAPGYLGLDQVNCRIPEDAPPGNAVLRVRSRDRLSDAITVPLR